jgi:hypothetical protein
MADLTGSLRAEIVESIKIRADFLKWKLVLIAALGAAALGFTGNNHTIPELLGFIPFVCAYVDILCTHTDLRIFVIAKFLRENKVSAEDSKAYEATVSRLSGAFFWESFALLGTTVATSLMLFGLVYYSDQFTDIGGRQMLLSPRAKDFLVLMGTLGLLVSLSATVYKAIYRHSKLSKPEDHAINGGKDRDDTLANDGTG